MILEDFQNDDKYQKKIMNFMTSGLIFNTKIYISFVFLVTGKWTQIKPTGDKLPCLQEHTAVTYKDCLYVFGGEVGFSAGTETPLWVYDIKANTWKKKKTKKGINIKLCF